MGLNTLHRLDYESKLLSFVDFKARCDWPVDEPDTIVVNKVYRLMDKDANFSNHVYDYMMKNIKHEEQDICNWIIDQLKLEDINVNKLQDLVNVSSKKAIASLLLFNRYYIDINVIRDILAELTTEQLNQDDAPLMNSKKFSFDRVMYKGVLQVFGNFCSFGDLLRISITNRLWHQNIMSKDFASQCQTFRTFKIGYNNVKYWYYKLSSQWYLTNLQVLHMNVSQDQLDEEDFPKLKQQTIQYLAADKFHFEDFLPNLKSLKISCRDNRDPMSLECNDKWQLQEQQTEALKFVVVEHLYVDYTEYIPKTNALLFENCNIVNGVLYYYIVSNVSKWVGVQRCYLLPKPRNYIRPSKPDDISKITPQVTLTFVYSEYWSRILFLLSSNSIYDKYILKLIIVMNYHDIKPSFINLLKFLIKVTNPNKPKSVSVLVHFNGNVVPQSDIIDYGYSSRDLMFWNFLQSKHAEIQNNANISKFFIGILRDWYDGFDFKTGDAFDLKTITKEQRVRHYQNWQDIMYKNDTPKSTVAWYNEFNQIEQSI